MRWRLQGCRRILWISWSAFDYCSSLLPTKPLGTSWSHRDPSEGGNLGGELNVGRSPISPGEWYRRNGSHETRIGTGKGESGNYHNARYACKLFWVPCHSSRQTGQKTCSLSKQENSGLCEIAAHNKKIKIKIENTPQISIPGDLSYFHVLKLVRQ
jgi:hypothetical protein